MVQYVANQGMLAHLPLGSEGSFGGEGNTLLVACLGYEMLGTSNASWR